MNNNKLSFIFAFLYFVVAGIVIALELHKRMFDRGNSEMTGLVSYLLTMPSSMLIEWIAKTILGIKIGGSDISFTVILLLSAILNAVFIYLIVLALLSLMRRTIEIN